MLPSPDHPLLRLAGDFGPSFPASGSGANGDGGDANHKFRLQAGGELNAPALALVNAAKSLAKLDELAAHITAIKPDGGGPAASNERAKLAFTGLIAIARGDDASAAQAMKASKPLLSKLSADAPESVRWPELVLAAKAIQRPSLRQPAIELLDVMADQAKQKKTTQTEHKLASGLWTHQIRNIRARAMLLIEAEKSGAGSALAFGTDPGTSQWTQVTQTRAETRGTGEPIPHWGVAADQLTHLPGHEIDLMYLAIPLRGDFQVDCELTGSPDRKIRLQYGGLAIGPSADLKHVESAVRPAGGGTLDQSTARKTGRVVSLPPRCQRGTDDGFY